MAFQLLIMYVMSFYAEEIKIMKLRKYRAMLEGQKINLAGTFNYQRAIVEDKSGK